MCDIFNWISLYFDFVHVSDGLAQRWSVFCALTNSRFDLQLYLLIWFFIILLFIDLTYDDRLRVSNLLFRFVLIFQRSNIVMFRSDLISCGSFARLRVRDFNPRICVMILICALSFSLYFFDSFFMDVWCKYCVCSCTFF